MDTNMPQGARFTTYYQKHVKCLKLGGLQPKTIEAYSSAGEWGRPLLANGAGEWKGGEGGRP